ncbi:MAG TPA: RodZ domain-containing protein [Desulfobacterales bacterium]|nr:RodZ domain-containing protein [Desulfobacterales bacterium]
MESSSEQASFGRYLRAIRVEKRISLDQVAEETRIAVRSLEAIDREDPQGFPPEPFLKGFLRAYAKVVGADGDEAVRRYDVHRMMIRETEDAGRQPERARSGLRRKLVAVLALMLILVVGSIVAWQWLSAPQVETAPIAADPGAVSPERPPADMAQNRPAPPPTLKPVPPAAPPRILTVSATENTWLKVVTDQGIPAEYNLKAGEHLKLEARSTFNLLIGNAGGVKLNLNNKPVNVPGKRGEVVNLQLP